MTASQMRLSVCDTSAFDASSTKRALPSVAENSNLRRFNTLSGGYWFLSPLGGPTFYVRLGLTGV